MRERISAATARRIALAATGLAEQRPAVPDRGHLRRTVARLNLLQIDSVTVLARAHYLPLFSRLGGYPRSLLDDAAWGPKPSLFEYWAHEASLLPLALHPLLRWRMARADRLEGIYGELGRFAAERRPYIDSVLARLRSDGPMAASELEGPRGAGGWWGWSDAKRALEWLFWAGHATTATRRGFERVYDLPERVLPAAILATATPDPADAHRALLQLSARALGIGTLGDLRDYFRLSPAEATGRVAELVEMGELLPVTVEGWRQPAYVHRAARWPRRVEGCALLCPFDPAVWERTRTERLFDFRYRLEIYTPAHKRQHGYYVLPFLLGDRLVARVDLKSSRATSTLHVLAAHAEPHAPADTAERLLAELQVMTSWLGLEHIAITPLGDFGPALALAHGNRPPPAALWSQEDHSMSDSKPDDTDPDAGTMNSAELHPAENAKNDREVAAITRTIQPKSDAKSRSGIAGSGSGADTEKG